MKMRAVTIGGALFVMLGSLAAEGQQEIVKVPDEPVNLGAIKQQLIEYESCTKPTCYVPQMEGQIEAARGLLKQSVATAKPGEKLALVLDIDETSLSNWAVELHDDFGYIHADSDMCIAVWCGRAIPGTLRLYKEAVAANVAVFFITGRPEPQRADTAANLKAEGYSQWQHLYLRPVDHPKGESTAAYKSGERAEIVKQGYRIVLNVGDQMSDLEGAPMAEHSVKLPNPFYLIP
jgi:predicted secreted acid phosphatase